MLLFITSIQKEVILIFDSVICDAFFLQNKTSLNIHKIINLKSRIINILIYLTFNIKELNNSKKV